MEMMEDRAGCRVFFCGLSFQQVTQAELKRVWTSPDVSSSLMLQLNALECTKYLNVGFRYYFGHFAAASPSSDLDLVLNLSSDVWFINQL